MNYQIVPTICPYCGCGCGIALQVLDGRLIGTLPLKTSPVNEGKLCLKGYSAHEFVVSPHRLTRPLIRKDSGLREADWETAITLTASHLQKVREKYGPDSIAFLASAKCTNEENYLWQKFARAAVGTNNIDHCARL
jgi:predicted molibdopterin-dependent oxidoreductase YjgC